MKKRQAMHQILVGLTFTMLTITSIQADPVTTPTTTTQPTTTKAKTLSAEIKAKEEAKKSMELDNALIRARLENELASLKAEIERLKLAEEARKLKLEINRAVAKDTHEEALFELNLQKEKLMTEVALSQAKLAKLMEEYQVKKASLDQEVHLAQATVQLLTENKNRLHAEIDEIKATKERTKYIEGKPVYLKEPLRKKDNILVISDRCIHLDGCITPWRANYITDKIEYLNNKDSSHPIFIVIGSSPGGSVMAGFQILRAMQGSSAPVYVVVKRFAASMAAVLTTLAHQSYAYPNAEILHHQPWGFAWVLNVRESKEFYEEMKKYWERLGGLVAKKMGISLNEFDKRLYAKSASGDWCEFANDAKKLKWVDQVINGIENSGMREMPDPADYTWRNYYRLYWMDQGVNKAKDTTTYLPPLDPHDFYYLYDPDNRYQIASSK